MTTSFQTIIALALVVLTVVTFIYHWWRNRKKPGCGGGCGCPSSQIKVPNGKKKAD